jgi:hypothetical protein
MGLVAALAVEKELEDAREIRENSGSSDDKFKDPRYVRPEVYKASQRNASGNFIMEVDLSPGPPHFGKERTSHGI